MFKWFFDRFHLERTECESLKSRFKWLVSNENHSKICPYDQDMGRCISDPPFFRRTDGRAYFHVDFLRNCTQEISRLTVFQNHIFFIMINHTHSKDFRREYHLLDSKPQIFSPSSTAVQTPFISVDYAPILYNFASF